MNVCWASHRIRSISTLNIAVSADGAVIERVVLVIVTEKRDASTPCACTCASVICHHAIVKSIVRCPILWAYTVVDRWAVLNSKGIKRAIAKRVAFERSPVGSGCIYRYVGEGSIGHSVREFNAESLCTRSWHHVGDGNTVSGRIAYTEKIHPRAFLGWRAAIRIAVIRCRHIVPCGIKVTFGKHRNILKPGGSDS